MLKTEVISIGIPVIFPDVDWSARDCKRFWGRFWDRFWPLHTAFPRIPLLQNPRWEKEKSRSTCSNRDGFLRVDWSEVSLFRLRFLFNDLENRPWSVTVTGSSIFWRRGSNGSQRLTGGECVKEKFLSDMGFWVREGLLVKVAFVGKMGTLDKEVVERRFSDKGVLGKEAFWDKKSASDSTSLSFWESQLRSRSNRQCQWINSIGIRVFS